MPAAKRAGRGRETRFDLVKCRAWREAVDAVDSEDGDLGQSTRRARLRKDLAQAMEAEQRIAIKAGTVVNADEVLRKWTDEISRCRSHLLGIPSRVKSRLPHLALTDIATIDALVREALKHLATGVAITKT